MKVKYILNNFMIGTRFKSTRTDLVVEQNRIDKNRTEVVYQFDNERQLEETNRILYGTCANYKRYEIIEK